MTRTQFSRFLIVLAMLAVGLFIASSPVGATDAPSEDIYDVLATTTGVTRAVDAGLVAIAERRVIEIQSDWSHNGKVSPQEVLAYNSQAEAWLSYAVGQWMTSEFHNWIILDPTLTLIGCASATDATGLHWIACALAGDDLQPLPGPNEDESSTSCAEDDPCWDCQTMGNQVCDPVLLPDTATDPAAADWTGFYFVLLLVTSSLASWGAGMHSCPRPHSR